MVGARLLFPYDGHVPQCFHELLGHRIERLGDGDFPTIAAIVLKSDALEKCRLRAEKELDRGRAALEKLSPSIFRDSLLELLAFTVQRDR